MINSHLKEKFESILLTSVTDRSHSSNSAFLLLLHKELLFPSVSDGYHPFFAVNDVQQPTLTVTCILKGALQNVKRRRQRPQEKGRRQGRYTLHLNCHFWKSLALCSPKHAPSSPKRQTFSFTRKALSHMPLNTSRPGKGDFCRSILSAARLPPHSYRTLFKGKGGQRSSRYSVDNLVYLSSFFQEKEGERERDQRASSLWSLMRKKREEKGLKATIRAFAWQRIEEEFFLLGCSQ